MKIKNFRKNKWVSKNAVIRIVTNLVEVEDSNWTCKEKLKFQPMTSQHTHVPYLAPGEFRVVVGKQF